MSKVWLVTGSASGLGRNIAEAVLASGDQLVATARDPRRLEDLASKYGKQVRTAALDVADEEAARAAVRAAVDAFGRLDVLVNNAGYGDVAPFEQLSAERFKAVMDTNFYGVVHVTRAALPVMRGQKSGWILQVSSVGGRLALPGSSPYHAAKWAVGGFTESLAQEVAPFGVKVAALEPGGMRTNWGTRAHKDVPSLLPEYEPSVGAVIKALHSLWGQENSDPAKVSVPQGRGRPLAQAQRIDGLQRSGSSCRASVLTSRALRNLPPPRPRPRSLCPHRAAIAGRNASGGGALLPPPR